MIRFCDFKRTGAPPLLNWGVRRHLIFNTLDFHVSTRYGEEPINLLRPFRLKIDYIVESFSLRIPKKIKTSLFHKLNVCVRYERSQNSPFFALEGIGSVEFVDPNIASIYESPQAEAARRVKEHLKEGIRVASQNDCLFAKHQELWDRLLSTTEDEFDHDCRISRSHRSRRWRCEAVLRITPTAYHCDVLVKDSRSLEIIQRHRVRTMEYALPYYGGIGFSKLRWDNDEVVGIARGDQEVFRFKAEL